MNAAAGFADGEDESRLMHMQGHQAMTGTR